MFLFFSIIQRFAIFLIAMIMTIVEQVTLAVTLPETMRGLQQSASSLLSWTESYFAIGSQYMVWVEMAGIDEKLVFMVFYFANLLVLSLILLLVKRLGRGITRSFKDRHKTKAPAAA